MFFLKAKTIPYFLAYRYLRSSSKGSFIGFMTKLCFFGICVSSFALTLILMVMAGFEHETCRKLRGVNSQAVISATGDNKIDYGKTRRLLKKHFSGAVKEISPVSAGPALLDLPSAHASIFVKGIDPETFGLVTSLEKKLIIGQARQCFSSILQNDGIILGQKLADSFGLKIGDFVSILIPNPSVSKKKIALQPFSLQITGIIKVGLEEYDNGVVLCSLNLFNCMFNQEGADQLLLKLQDDWQSPDHSWIDAIRRKFFDDDGAAAVQFLRTKLSGLTVQHWKELSPTIVASLVLEKYAMFLILFLIVLVALLNLASLLFINVQAKKKNIAILRVLGMSSVDVAKIFVFMGMLITLTACAVGEFFAFLAALLLQKYPFIQLPDVYYVSHLPVNISFYYFVLVFIVASLAGLISSVLAAKMASNVDIPLELRSG
jgi:lipoprotein-releasing system permease protein